MKLNYCSVLAAVLCVGLGANAIASEQEDQWYVAGLATYIDPDSDRDLDNEIAGGQLSLGKALSEHINLELEVDYLDVSGDGGPDADLTGAALNGMYVWNRAGRFSPYILAGVGALNVDPDGSGDDTDFQGQIGPGFLLDLWNERWALRAEALGRSSDSDTDLLVNVGIQYAFGGKKEEPAPAPAPVAAVPVDSDGDGVTDDIDQCPNTPRGTPVDEVGCPLPVDSDGDGVNDDIDECPDTIKGALVDEVGCAYQLSGIDFAFDSADLGSQDQTVLNEVAGRLVNDYPELTITIEGHTDSRGAEAYNQDLSERRAQSAKDYLVGKDVAAERITVVGLGESAPIADNETEEGRAANRRVVIIRD